MLLSYQNIKAFLDHGQLMEDFDLRNLKAASYDLRLGSVCYLSSVGNHKSKLIKMNGVKTITIPCNGIFMFQTREKVNIPNNIAGKLSLRMGLVRKGCIMPTQTQVDPGYNNYLFGMIYNLSDSPVDIKYEEHIVNIEFYELKEPTAKPYSDEYDVNYVFEQFVSENVTSTMDTLQNGVATSLEKVNATEQSVKKLLNMLTILSIMLALISILMAGMTVYLNNSPIASLKQNIERLESTQNDQEKTLKVLEKSLYHVEKCVEAKHEGKDCAPTKN
jgi:deoxycytidine triphosphate deaminase